jgi:hypothetical protein
MNRDSVDNRGWIYLTNKPGLDAHLWSGSTVVNAGNFEIVVSVEDSLGSTLVDKSLSKFATRLHRSNYFIKPGLNTIGISNTNLQKHLYLYQSSTFSFVVSGEPCDFSYSLYLEPSVKKVDYFYIDRMLWKNDTLAYYDFEEKLNGFESGIGSVHTSLRAPGRPEICLGLQATDFLAITEGVLSSGEAFSKVFGDTYSGLSQNGRQYRKINSLSGFRSWSVSSKIQK